jgi:hypothetical protein
MTEKPEKEAEAQPPPKMRPLNPFEREPLDLESLDLSVEPVEERISPSETNVFDK